jgi:threonine dehydratase
VRGAINALTELSPEERKKGVVARSSGNFAQAVAFIAYKLSIPATLVLPEHIPTIKLQGIQKYHPEIVFAGRTHEEGNRMVEKLVKEKGLVPLHPYNNYRTMAGQGTIGLEILGQLPEIEHFYCPIGGGGLMSGCATALKETRRSIHVEGVEPIGASDYYSSRRLGSLQHLQKTDTIADGLRAPCVGDLNYPILNTYVDDVTIVRDADIISAMKWLYEKEGIVTEPSAAAALAGFLQNSQNISGNTVILLSGKNVDPENFQKWISV